MKLLRSIVHRMKLNLREAIIIHLAVILFHFHSKAKTLICLKKITSLIELQEFKFSKKIIIRMIKKNSSKLFIQIETLKLLKMVETTKMIIVK